LHCHRRSCQLSAVSSFDGLLESRLGTPFLLRRFMDIIPPPTATQGLPYVLGSIYKAAPFCHPERSEAQSSDLLFSTHYG